MAVRNAPSRNTERQMQTQLPTVGLHLCFKAVVYMASAVYVNALSSKWSFWIYY